jgi:outer membrane usher protein
MQRLTKLPLASALGLAGCVALGAISLGGHPASMAQTRTGSAEALREISSQIVLNGQAIGAWTLLERGGILYASASTFEAWQIRRRVGAESLNHAGQNWFPLASAPGFEVNQNFATQNLVLRYAAHAIIGPPKLPTPVAATSAPAPTAPPASPPQVATASAAGSPVPAGAVRILPLEVRVNGAPSGNWPLLESGGMLYATEEAFEEWRLNRREGAQPIVHRAQTWYALNAVPGYESRLNFAEQSIDLVFSPSAFAATRLASDRGQKLELTPSIPAVFFNYDLNYSQARFTTAGTTNTRDLGALTEAGFSGSWGVITSSFVGRNLVSHDASLKPTWRRLETTFARDFPDSKLTLRVGDASTRAGIGSENVFFGGVQLSRNFALSPGFIAQPTPLLQGSSSSPSTVELYVNDVLRQTANVPTGPFAIDNFPLLTGGGNVRMVVRDVLGRETVLVQPFFSHSSLLEQGLSDWSIEAGALRRNLGTLNGDYGQRFASGLYRYGISKTATGEVSAQWGEDTQTLGFGFNMALPSQVLGYFSLAASRDKAVGQGFSWSLGAEYSHLRHGFNARYGSASGNYRQLGMAAAAAPNRTEAFLNYNYTSESYGSVGVGLAQIMSSTNGEINTASANYSMRLGERRTLSISATRAFGSGVAAPATTISLSLNIPLESRRNSTSSLTHRAGQTDAYTGVSQGPVGEFGTGWRVLVGTHGNRAYAEAGLYHFSTTAELNADISSSSFQQNLRLGVNGALVFADGELYASRKVQDSFAIVEVAGFDGIGVGFQGSAQVKTDANGRAFLPRLLSFQRNSVRLDPSELPISAEIDNIEQIAVPSARSGVKIVFPVRAGRAALIKIVLADGQDAPAGAEIELVGDKQEFFVARRGEAFITGLQSKNMLKLKYNGNSCKIAVELPADTKTDDILRLGPLRCEGVTR